MSRYLRRIVIAGITLFLLVGLVGTFAQAVEEPIIIKFGHAGSLTDPIQTGVLKFKELVEERSQGRVIVEVYPAAQLGSERELQEATQLGHITMCGSGMWGLLDARLDVLTLPVLWRDWDHVNKVMWGPVGKELLSLGEAKGLKSVGWIHTGWRHITNNKHPIFVPADMKGMKIRVPEIRVLMDTMRAFGARPTPIPFGELYSALQQGVAEAEENPLKNIYHHKFYEVQKYLSLIGYVYNGNLWWANLEWWNSLPPDIQEIIMETIREGQLLANRILEECDDELLYKLLDEGMIVNKVRDRSGWEKLAKKAWEPWLERVGEETGKELIEKIRSVE